MRTKKANMQGSTTAVVGFGRAGQAVCRYLAACGARVLVSDMRRLDELSNAERELLERCSAGFEGGGHSTEYLSAAEKVILSPGVDYRHPALEHLRRTKIEILGELGLAADKFRAPVIAVTGTNGKTTVTELIGSMLQAAGKRVFVGGNIGTPIGEYLLAQQECDVIVLELSSFQLELAGDFVPEVGVLLNISPDHLDRHQNLDNYAAAKLRMFQGVPENTRCVVNDDDQLCKRYLEEAGIRGCARFGFNQDCEAVIEQTGPTGVSGEARITLFRNGARQVFDLSNSPMANLSGLLNGAAALLAISRFNLEQSVLELALRSFVPGNHRLQKVAEIDGVVYIDDSKATNTGAVINGINQVGGRVILIAGGRDKGDDYRLLRNAVAAHVKHLILIGEASDKLGQALADLAPIDYPASMGEAVVRAAAAAKPGDTVLLSPACASFDMFENYQQRGVSFSNEVQHIAERLSAGVH